MELTPQDKRLIMEARLLNVFADERFGKKRIVDSPDMTKMQKEILDLFITMHNEGLFSCERT